MKTQKKFSDVFSLAGIVACLLMVSVFVACPGVSRAIRSVALIEVEEEGSSGEERSETEAESVTSASLVGRRTILTVRKTDEVVAIPKRSSVLPQIDLRLSERTRHNGFGGFLSC